MDEKPQSKIETAMLGIMTDIGAIGKAGRNEFQKYSFRGIDQVLAALQPLLVKYKVNMKPHYNSHQLHAQEKGFTATINLQLNFVSAEDGSHCAFSSCGQGADSGDKATNKAMTAALKYALCHGLCIRENEIATDTDSDSPVVVAKGTTGTGTRVKSPISVPKNMVEF